MLWWWFSCHHGGRQAGATTDADHSVTLNILCNDSDPEGVALTIIGSRRVSTVL
jgi:hypothetical protein